MRVLTLAKASLTRPKCQLRRSSEACEYFPYHRSATFLFVIPIHPCSRVLYAISIDLHAPLTEFRSDTGEPVVFVDQPLFAIGGVMSAAQVRAAASHLSAAS
eukprot:6188063-Pleurochrysis_carterae.AAC.4